MIQNPYNPLLIKIKNWINYEEKKPQIAYFSNPETHDLFRKENDTDCILTNGNLLADTIFSLWLPFRFTLVHLNSYKKLNKYGNINNKISFLKAISSPDILEELLPLDNDCVRKLITLFELGQQRCNVMILRDRRIQSRGFAPYYDYMPWFLYECFDNGEFSKYFDNDNAILIHWIKNQKLNMFFEGEIIKDNIKDLAGNGNVKNGIPNDICILLDNYISILQIRKNELD